MAAHAHHPTSEERVPAHLPSRRLCLDYNSNISKWSDGFHGVLQRRKPQCEEASEVVEQRGGGQAVQILLQGVARGIFHLAEVRREGVAAVNVRQRSIALVGEDWREISTLGGVWVRDRIRVFILSAWIFETQDES